MSAASLALQRGLFEKLSADLPLMAKITGVFDWAPDNQALPYVQLGEDIASDWSTKTFTGSEHRLTLHVWSFATGRLEGKRLMADVMRILQTAPAVTDFQLVTWHYLASQSLRDADTRLHHGVLEYRARMISL
jgi:Protein of unknown function (DUF3168)